MYALRVMNQKIHVLARLVICLTHVKDAMILRILVLPIVVNHVILVIRLVILAISAIAVSYVTSHLIQFATPASATLRAACSVSLRKTLALPIVVVRASFVTLPVIRPAVIQVVT